MGSSTLSTNFLVLLQVVTRAFHLYELARALIAVPYDEVRNARRPPRIVLTEELADYG